MTHRIPTLVLSAVLAVACAADEQPAEETQPTQETSAASADDAALAQALVDYETHYNAHHASVVAEMFLDSAVALYADGSEVFSRAEAQAHLETQMANSPTIDLESLRKMVFGDYAVDLGRWSITATPPGGAPMSADGHYMSLLRRMDGAWKINALVTNFDTVMPPEAYSPPTEPGDPVPENGTLKDFGAQWSQAFAAADWAALAALYAEDAVVSYPNGPLAEGRAAIQERFTNLWTAGNQSITIHDIETIDFGDGWLFDGGWYEITGANARGPANGGGTYFNLLRRQADGSVQIVWAVSNLIPAPAN